MAIITGRLSVRSCNKIIDIEPCFSSDFSITLKQGLSYCVGIDQSTTCTGIAIQSVNEDITLLIDFKRDTENKESFYRDLKYFLKSTLHEANIKYFVYEKPIYTPNQRYTSRILIELAGRVQEWVEEIGELQGDTVVDCMFPQSWQSLVIDSSKGKNRMRKKECIAEDLCDKYPEFRSYLDKHFSKDLDAFDALGILTGYRQYAYTPDGIPKICGTIEKRHTSLVCYRYVKSEDITDFNALNAFMGDTISVFNPVFKVFNVAKNKMENIRMASSNNPCTVTILPSKYLEELKWKFDFKVQDGFIMVAYILNTAKFSSGSLSALKGVLPWNEIVQSI